MNRLGSSDLMVGEISFGCMSIGTDETTAVPLIREALAAGVNFLDTADLYDAGRNEELVGKAVRGRRGDVILATKVGNRRVPGRDGWVWDPSRAYILQAVHDSLRRLQTDYIDLYQLHGGTLDDPIDDTIDAFEQLKREGVIRHYGISSIRPNVIREYLRRSNIVSVMSQYSILDRRPEEEVLPLLETHGVSVIARGPVASGALADGREDRAQRGFLDQSGDDVVALRRDLQAFKRPGRGLTQLALRYSLAHPAVATVIPGASSAGQLRDNLAAANTPALTDEEVRAIRALQPASTYTQHR